MACCCGENLNCSQCTPPPMQVDIDVTIPASMLLLSARGCVCSNSLTLTESVVMLPSKTIAGLEGYVAYENKTARRWIQAYEYPCSSVSELGFRINFVLYFGATTDVDFSCSGNPYTCVQTSAGTFNPGGLAIQNGGSPSLMGHPCVVPPGKSLCCYTGSKTYDFIRGGQFPASIGTYTVTLL